MNNTRLGLASVLLLFLVLTLAVEKERPWANSKANTFEISSGVLSGTGGKSQSPDFTLNVSAGAQGSPTGPQFSDNFELGGGWVYTTERGAKCGDVNNDPDGIVNIGDVVFLVSYLYKGGPPPVPAWVADCNSDSIINVGDVVYLISYLYRGGPPPCETPPACGMFASASRLDGVPGQARVSLAVNGLAERNQPALTKASLRDSDELTEISVMAKFDRAVAGIELEIEFDPSEVELLDPELSSLTKGLQLFAGVKDGIQKIGIVDLSGKNFLPPGEGNLVTLRARGNDLSSIKIKNAVFVDRDAVPLALELSGELNLEMAKGGASTPERFALSQNYPNPFNPQTQIRYALPERCQVKLSIYNVRGQRVRVLVNEFQAAGRQTVLWDGTNEAGQAVASGIYFYRLEAGKFTDTKSMVLLK